MAHNFDKTTRITQSEALPGRMTPMPVATTHAVLHHSISHVPDGMAVAIFAMGCFWGVERLFWQQPGVYSTAAGYTGGYTPNPTYREVCSGQTGHAEAVRVVFDPQVVAYAALLGLFWEHHDPTQGMRQGGDIGSQYRSALFPQDDAQQEAARASLAAFARAMAVAGALSRIGGPVTVAAILSVRHGRRVALRRYAQANSPFEGAYFSYQHEVVNLC